MMMWIGKSVLEIPALTHRIQIWPSTLFTKHEQHIKILLKVTSEHVEKPEELECTFLVRLYFVNIKELKFQFNPVTQVHVPHSLSHIGIKTMIKYLHKTHYITEPSMKTVTKSEVTQFCHEHLHANDFTYFSHKELVELSKYFNIVHGVIFSSVTLGRKVLYKFNLPFILFECAKQSDILNNLSIKRSICPFLAWHHSHR